MGDELPCPHVRQLDFIQLEKRFCNKQIATSVANRSLKCQGSGCDVGIEDIWGCLAGSCSFFGCGRQRKKHALDHWTYRQHPLAIKVATTQIWCFECNHEVVDEDENLSKLRGWVGSLTEPKNRGKSEVGDAQDGGEADAASGSRRINKSVVGACGLQNLGNTCYMNASMQGLLHMEPFVQFFRECPFFLPIRNSTTPLPAKKRLLLAMNDTIEATYGGKVRTFSPGELLRSFVDLNPSFRGYGQQDSQEFLGHVLDNLHEELKYEAKPADQELIQKHLATPAAAESSSAASSAAAGSTEISETADPTPRVGNLDAGSNAAVGSGAPKKAEDKNASVKPKYFSSIVSEVFEGSLLSEVTCLQCKKVSKTIERFRILPVSIPSKKQRQKIVQHNLADDNATVSCGPSRRRSGGTWMSFFKRMFGFEKSEDISLRDCLSSFCSLEELSGTDQYKCEHCKTLNDSTKKLSALQLPEIMCVHVKRFRFDGYFGTQYGTKVSEHVEFPLHDLDMTAFIHPSERDESINTKFDLIGIVNHRGGLGGGHYIGYAKNFIDGQWYEFDDALVSAVSPADISRVEAYILFYRVKETPAKKQERQRIRQIVEDAQSHRSGAMAAATVNSPQQSEAGESPDPEVPFVKQADPGMVFISAYWYQKFLTLNRPGQIDNHIHFCKHNNINVCAADSSHFIMVPSSAFDELARSYGGGPRVDCLRSCDMCAFEIAELNKRREHEQKLIQQHDRTFVDEGENWYIIDRLWLQKWLHFANDGGELPGEITNFVLLNADGTPRPNLEKGRHYRGVNSTVWAIFHKLYGGGPPIPRSRLDIYALPPEEESRL